MFSVCPQCGAYEVEKTIDPSGPVAICSTCHYVQPFLQQPLFIITGASGTGKTTIEYELVSRMRRECVVLEADILWGVVGASPEDNYRTYRSQWLRLALNIGQSGLPVVLCGTSMPDQNEPCPERRYFSTIHYLALVCDDHLLRERLRSRPAWRQGSDAFLQEMSDFNRWIKDHAATTEPPMTLYDTSDKSLDETVNDVMQWIRERM